MCLSQSRKCCAREEVRSLAASVVAAGVAQRLTQPPELHAAKTTKVKEHPREDPSNDKRVRARSEEPLPDRRVREDPLPEEPPLEARPEPKGPATTLGPGGPLPSQALRPEPSAPPLLSPAALLCRCGRRGQVRCTMCAEIQCLFHTCSLAGFEMMCTECHHTRMTACLHRRGTRRGSNQHFDRFTCYDCGQVTSTARYDRRG